MQRASAPRSGGVGARGHVPALLSLLLMVASGRAPAAEPLLALNVQSAPLAENLGVGGVVGRIRFLGMLVIPSVTVKGGRLSQLSDIAWDDDAEVLYALSDKGTLFHLHPIIRNGALADLKLSRVAPLRELRTDRLLRDRWRDAEGLDILRGRNGRKDDAELIVSFERYPRILRYRPDGYALGEYTLPSALTEREAYSNPNRMLEGVCYDSRFGALTAPEIPLAHEDHGYNRLYNLTGKSWRYPIDPQDRIVGLYCLDDGDVLVLQGNFGTRFWRSHTALKRVRLAEPTAADVPLEPRSLFRLESSKGYQIDNFEGIARHRGDRFFLVSDDNDFFLQRTLLLYFELLDE